MPKLPVLPKLSKKLSLKESGASYHQQMVSRDNQSQKIWD